jgi:hypothetical protein
MEKIMDSVFSIIIGRNDLRDESSLNRKYDLKCEDFFDAEKMRMKTIEKNNDIYNYLIECYKKRIGGAISYEIRYQFNGEEYCGYSKRPSTIERPNFNRRVNDFLTKCNRELNDWFSLSKTQNDRSIIDC